MIPTAFLSRPVSRIIGLAVLAALVGGFSCLADLGTNGGGEVDDGVYHIEFKSWAWEDEPGNHYLCHCVRNLGSSAVRIDWPAVGLSGWAKFRKTLFIMGPIPSGDVEEQETKIVYGRRSVEVATKFPLGVNHVGLGTPDDVAVLPASASATTAQAEIYPEGPLVSEGQIAVPSDAVATGRTLDELDAMIQENPDLLQEISMTFTSTPEIENGVVTGITYECTYGVENATQETSLSMRIDDPSIHEVVFQTAETVSVNWNEFAGDIPFDAFGRVEVSAGLEDLRTETTTMSFVDFDGNVLGRMPITVITAR